MDSVIIDTDVLSYLFKGDTRAESYRSQLHGKLGVLSFMTIAELDFWANARNWGATRRAAISFPGTLYCGSLGFSTVPDVGGNT